MSRNVTVGIVLVVLVVLAIWYLMNSQKSQTPTQVVPDQTQVEPSPSTQASDSGQMVDKNLVKVSSSGFMPQIVAIKTGESLTFMNDDSENHTVNSAPHPTHTLYSFLNLGVIKPGEKRSVMFDSAGSYQYHDHLNPSLTGSVTVE